MTKTVGFPFGFFFTACFLAWGSDGYGSSANIFISVISTAALYFLILEAGFGLCAVCLPSLAGSLKLKAVQNLIDAFTSIFSTRSSRSRESFRSNHATRAHRLNSLTDSDHAQIIGGATNKSANSFEMQPVPNISNAGIQLTREFDLRAEVV